MKRDLSAPSFPLLLPVLMLTAAALVVAQPPADGPGAGKGKAGFGKGGFKAPEPAALVLKEAWKDIRENIPLLQEHVLNPDLMLATYGTGGAEDFHVTNEGGVPHIWNGLCATSCALTLASKENFLDLTGRARIRWYMKTSGFHEIRPVVKLADGNFYIGDHVDANPVDYVISEFYLSQVHWLKLDMPKVQTKGTLLDKIDLSKVDAVGYADLTPGSGHGTGGYADMGWIEVYGKAVKRDAAAQ